MERFHLPLNGILVGRKSTEKMVMTISDRQSLKGRVGIVNTLSTIKSIDRTCYRLQDVGSFAIQQGVPVLVTSRY